MIRTLTTAATISVLATSGFASTTMFTDFVGFGDSLSDKGRLPINPLINTQPPQDGSRFSDGPTWMERVGAKFEENGGGNINLSLGGATAGANTADRNAAFIAGEGFNTAANGPRDATDPDDIPFIELTNFEAQINAFLNGPTTSTVGGLVQTVGNNPLVTVLLGGNDFLALSDSPSVAEATAVGTAVIGAISNGITALHNASDTLDDFMVANLPSFALSPSAIADASFFELFLLDAATQQFNTALSAAMSDLGTNLGVNIEIFDLYSSFALLHAEGVANGLIADDSCLPGMGVNNCPNAGDSADYLFLDDIHPNSFLQAGIGDAALAQLDGRIALAPVPLPAGLPLLMIGIGAFAVIGRRKASA